MKEINCRALLILLLCFTNNIWAQKPALAGRSRGRRPARPGERRAAAAYGQARRQCEYGRARSHGLGRWAAA